MAYCIPILVNAAMTCDVSIQQTPEMIEKAGSDCFTYSWITDPGLCFFLRGNAALFLGLNFSFFGQDKPPGVSAAQVGRVSP